MHISDITLHVLPHVINDANVKCLPSHWRSN